MGARYFYYRVDTIKLQVPVLTGHFLLKKRGNTELNSLCISRRLMLIDCCANTLDSGCNSF